MSQPDARRLTPRAIMERRRGAIRGLNEWGRKDPIAVRCGRCERLNAAATTYLCIDCARSR